MLQNNTTQKIIQFLFFATVCAIGVTGIIFFVIAFYIALFEWWV